MAGNETFFLFIDPIDHGGTSTDRIPELQSNAQWIEDGSKRTYRFHAKILVSEDFRIDRLDSALWNAFTSNNPDVRGGLSNAKQSIFIKEGEDT